jgi:hypothetical protein
MIARPMFDAQQNVVRYCLGYCNPGLCGRERDRHFANPEHGKRHTRSFPKTSGTQRIAPSFLIPGVLRREKQQRAQPASFIWGMSVEAACRRRFRLYL